MTDHQIFVMSALLIIACYTDFKSRRIPNFLIIAGISTALLYSAFFTDLNGVIDAVLGGATGLILLLPLYLLNKMGAGDIKLLAMCGFFLGPSQIVWATLFSLIAGGFLAAAWLLVVIGMRSSLYSLIGTFAMYRVGGRSSRQTMQDSPLKQKMPYAAAIAAGTSCAIWLSP